MRFSLVSISPYMLVFVFIYDIYLIKLMISIALVLGCSTNLMSDEKTTVLHLGQLVGSWYVFV